MSKKGKTLLKGHGLLYEGEAFTPEGTKPYWNLSEGCGKCSCGALSPVLPSKNQRKAWHRQHKDEIRAQGE